MFYIYLQNIKSATGPHVIVTDSLSRNISMKVLLKRAREMNCRQLSNCLLKHSVCIMSHRNVISLAWMLKLQRLAFIYIIQQFITVEAILSSKAFYRIEMLCDVS